MRSLVWLALAPVVHREKILSEIDARQLAEAWIGPEPVLAALKEVLSPKKAEMLAHFLSSSAPDRDNATFGYLFEAGLQAPKTGAEAQAA
ncbi:MAG TPA: hypothetical protein PKC28_01800 [Bdellovibrionales bacterium]|nr:hypothetical protein [Bdellovibrionales bacterium]